MCLIAWNLVKEVVYLIKIRLHGVEEEIQECLAELESNKNFKILSVSEFYKDRGNSIYYRCYIDAEMV